MKSSSLHFLLSLFYLSLWRLFSRQHLSKFRCYFLTTIQKPTKNFGWSWFHMTSDCSALEIKKVPWNRVGTCPTLPVKAYFWGLPFWSHLRQSLQHHYVIIEIKNVCFRTYFVFIVSNSSIFHVLDECLSNHFIPFHLLVPCLKNTGPRPKFIFG